MTRTDKKNTIPVMALAVIAFFTWVGVAAGDHAVDMSKSAFTQIRLKRLLRSKIETIVEIANNPTIVDEVRKQNEQPLSDSDIKEIDKEWAHSGTDTPFKQSLQHNRAGTYFQSLVDFNHSIYSEAFLTDRRGANVAAYPPTTDYWQGDEEKWIASFHDGDGEIYVGPIEFDESSRTTAVQISVPVMDKDRAIGVLIVGVKLTYVQAKYFSKRQSDLK